jgi:hypothetical protein
MGYGFLPQFDTPRVGDCVIPDSLEYDSTDELVEVKTLTENHSRIDSLAFVS